MARNHFPLAVAAGLTSVVLWLLPGMLSAEVFTVYDLNSSLTVEPNSDNGITTWRIDGVDHMSKQWFWYRSGGTGPEQPIHQLGTLQCKLSDVGGDPNCERLSLRYTGSGVQVDIMFTLNGSTAGSGTSHVSEAITITNNGSSTLEFHLFQYSDFDLNGSAQDANVAITGGNTATQTDEGLVCISESVSTRRPDHYQVDFVSNILASLSDANATSLNDANGPVGPGDLSWAFQWDLSIPAGSSETINKTKSVVPEPATLGLLGAAWAVMAFRRRRGRS